MNSPASQPQPGDLQTTEEVLYEARRKIYARSVSGFFARWRVAMVW